MFSHIVSLDQDIENFVAEVMFITVIRMLYFRTYYVRKVDFLNPSINNIFHNNTKLFSNTRFIPNISDCFVFINICIFSMFNDVKVEKLRLLCPIMKYNVYFVP